MKLIKFFTASLIMAAMFTSCSKDKDKTPPPSGFNIVGLWEGKLGTGSAIPTGYFGLQIKENGKLDRLNDGSVSGSGTWTVTGNTFKGQYTAKSNGVVIDVTATVDKISNKLTGGIWENSADNGGTWYASKK